MKLSPCTLALIATGVLAPLPSSLAADGTDLGTSLEALREKHQVPALAAMGMKEGKIVASGVAGFRKSGSGVKAAIGDLWHIGSCTKSMTGTLAGVLVDAGTIRWETTVGEVFPELKRTMKPEWAPVRLDQLLTNTSGAPNKPPAAAWTAAFAERGTPVAQRLTFAKSILSEPLEAPPGTKNIYSNQGFAIAGAMLERMAKRPYEALLEEKVFRPLGMKSAGFGTPKGAQPRGHQGGKGSFKPVEPGPGSDNPTAITPAGRVHCSLEDFARYASWHARGPLTDVKLMSDATFTKLHTPPAGQGYAMGWIVAPRDWAGGNALTHNGSNTMWYAVMWLAPAKQAAYVALTNAAGRDAEAACDEAIASMIALP